MCTSRGAFLKSRKDKEKERGAIFLQSDEAGREMREARPPPSSSACCSTSSPWIDADDAEGEAAVKRKTSRKGKGKNFAVMMKRNGAGFDMWLCVVVLVMVG